MNLPKTIGVVATSSAVPQVELAAGIARMREAGLAARVHPRVADQHFTFAGTDAARAAAFYEYAADPSIDVVWCARGGYGAQRILPLLEAMSRQHGPPPSRKLLVGYSDVTVLHEFVRSRWGWSTLHAPMPASGFVGISAEEWAATVSLVTGRPAEATWFDATLDWITPPPAATLEAPLVGGNLTLWATLAGTPYRPAAAGHILFLEDVGEPFYRLDRMMTQIDQAGLLNDTRAIVLGDFHGCRDEEQSVLASADGAATKPLRPTYTQREAFQHVFAALGRRLGIPVASGLPVGHGPRHAPLPLGAAFELIPPGRLRLKSWDWLGGRT